jgi:hypothetical protein
MMVREGPSGKSCRDAPSEEDCRAAIERKGIGPGSKILQKGEKIPRTVEAILADWRVQLAFCSHPIYPTEIVQVLP